MFTELSSVLGGNLKDRGEFIGVCESGADGSFLIHHFLSYFLKNDKPVCFVTLSQSYNHYNTVSQKIGLGLNAKRESKQLTFVEGLKILGEFITCNDSQNAKGDNPFQSEAYRSLLPFYTYVESIYKTMLENSLENPVIIIDNFSILLNIGYQTKDLIAFLHYMQNLIENKSSLIVLVDSGIISQDEDAELLWRHVCHSCTLRLEVSGLKSGYCKDVHGEMKIHFQDSLEPKPCKTMQFKLSDKNVALFAAGMSSAVL